MIRSTFLIFAAVVSIVYGVGQALAPAFMNEMHGVASSPGTSLVTRYFGTALIGVGIMAWLARNAADSDALLAFMRGGFVLALGGLIVSLHAMMVGLMNTMGWVPVVVQSLLTLGFIPFAFMKR